MNAQWHEEGTQRWGFKLSLSGTRLTGEVRSLTVRAFLCALGTVSGLSVAVAQVTFTRILEGDIAKDTGLSYGCAWGDYDNDGCPDLIVADGFTAVNRLYHNNGDGTFSRVTEGPVVNDPGDSGAAVWGDYDNDGDLDLFVTNYDPPRDCFYRNEGDGQFTKVIEGAWVSDSGFGIGAAWADYNNDGFLDLYVTNNGGQHNFLYRNNGDGTMTRITSGPAVNSGGYSHGCVWVDYDGDGDADLFVPDPSGAVSQDQQFLNNGDGTFTRVTVGPYVDPGPITPGISCADYDNDGDMDLLVNGKNSNQLYRNDDADGFTLVAASGLEQGGVSFSSAWGDYDNDGYLDVFITNYDFTSLSPQANLLFHNNGDGTFSQVTEGAVANDRNRSCGCAWADYDNDGDLDLFVANGVDNTGAGLPPEPGSLYRNDGSPNHWLILRLVGLVSNRSAIGAKVRVRATIRGKTFWQLREVSGGSGQCSQNDLRVHFGLGDAESVETVLIEWPSGVTQVLKNVAVNQHREVVEEPIPCLALSFSEGGGTATLNVGRLAGTGELTPSEEFPAFSPQVPSGPWAPPNNLVSIDLGANSGGPGCPAVALQESLAALDAFTLCGWLNTRDLSAGSGGNRIIAALASSDGSGLELVQNTDGALQLGINQSAQSSPVRSSDGLITEDPEAGLGNWVFFATTYDGTHPSGNAQFFFGTAEHAAQPDAGPIDYDRGAVQESGPITVGNVSREVAASNPPGEGDHFRGLMDEIEIYDRVLSLEEIQEVQKAPAPRLLASEPGLTIYRDGAEVVLQWQTASSRQPQYCAGLRTAGAIWRDVRTPIEADGFRHTVRQPINSAASQMFFRLP
jgi:enediyne biosynthesis protein E4